MNLNLNSPTLKFSISGLRGLYPQDIHPGNLPEIIAAFDAALPAGPVAVALDSRPTGPAIEAITLGHLAALGREVHSLGLIPTPTIKAYIRAKKLAGGLMISASHNPVTYNAYKFIGKGGLFFSEAENQRWRAALGQKVTYRPHNRQGKILRIPFEAVADFHIAQALQAAGATKGRRLKVAIDPVGGCARQIARRLLEKMGHTVVGIFEEGYPDFPRPPEPVPTALKKLGALVVKEKCDLGFAFDPDADRLALVGPDGKPLGEELTLPLALMGALPARKGPVVVNLSSSHLNRLVAEKYGRKFYRSKVGEANVVSLMQKTKAAFGGEGNGGVIDPQVASLGRDSLAGMAHILQLLQREKKSLPEIISPLPAFVMHKEAIHLQHPDDLKQLFQTARQAYRDFMVNEEDGLHFSHPSGLPWVHIRSSNTEPIVRIIAEAASQPELKKLLAVFRK